jgi:hypothetical protein
MLKAGSPFRIESSMPARRRVRPPGTESESESESRTHPPMPVLSLSDHHCCSTVPQHASVRRPGELQFSDHPSHDLRYSGYRTASFCKTQLVQRTFYIHAMLCVLLGLCFGNQFRTVMTEKRCLMNCLCSASATTLISQVHTLFQHHPDDRTSTELILQLP